MADLNANINVGIETTQALNQLKALQKQISQFHQSVAKSSGQATVAQRDLQRNFVNSVNSIQGFSAELKTVRTTAESFTNSLEKNKFSMRQYFRNAAGATKTFGKNFSAEFSAIEKTAIERVKTLQTQYIKLGRDAQGAMQAIAIRPTTLNMKDLGTQTAIAAQKQVLFNQLVKQGSTNLLNFGKNTQWAGRQLMVGFTLPLATLGMTAGRVFFDMEKAAIKFKKVYGDLFTAPAETEKAMESIIELGQAYASYGIAVSETLDTAADAAAAGFAGVDLQNQTSAALKLSVLGQLDLQKALETTISLQNAFQLSSADLAGEIDFLNAVENQTVVALEDITEAVPRVAPVIKQLGGDVRDLAFFLAAMKEGGVNAAQGANALKSGLASLINPSEKAADMLAGLGININSIISQNQGDLAGTVFAFARSLDTLDPLKRAQAIEQLFGKFQFARISALFDNITREGTQAQRVLELAGSTVEELASLSESELGVSAASSMNKFRKAVEQIKVALVPIGELFVEIATPFVEFGTRMLDAFNSLPEGIKKSIGGVITIIGGLGPIALMTFGLINNGIANMIKFFATVRLGYLKITGQAKGIGDETQYMTQEQLEAAAAAASLDQAHSGLIQRFTAEKVVVDRLRDAYTQAAAAGARFAAINPGMMLPGKAPQKLAAGGFVSGSGNGDTVPAMLTPGEFVVKKKEAQVFLPLLQAINEGKVPGFANGGVVGGNDKLVSMFGEFALRLQEKSQNMGRRSSQVNDPEQVLSVLATRIGEARGIVPSQSQVSKGNFDSIADQYSGLVSEFVSKLNSEFETTFSSIKNSDERFKNAWLAAGKKVEQDVQKISSEVDKGVVRKTFGLDPDFMGTAPTMPRRTGGTELERARKSAFNLQDTGVRSYNTAQIRGASQAIFERRTGKSAKDMQMGHALGSVEQSLQSVVNDPRASNAIKKAAASFGIFVTNKTVEGIKESTQQASPSKEAHNAGKNIGVGAINGIKETTDDAKMAGEQLGQAATSGVRKGPRRASTNPEVMAALAGTSQAQINTGPRRASSPAGSVQDGVFVPVQQQVDQTNKATLSMAGFADKASKATFALSAVSGILTMFGGEMSAVTGAVMGISSAMFALIQITSLLSSTKLGAVAAERARAVAQGIGGGFGAAGSLLGTGGFLSKVANGFKFVLRFLGPIGLGLSALAIAVPFIAKAFEDNANRINGLGAAANLTEEKLNFLAEKFSIAATSINWAERGAALSATAGKSTEEKEQVVDLMIDPQFEVEFKTEIAGIKNATKEQGELALQALATQLRNSGFEADAVDAIISAIVSKANRTDLNLNFGSILIDDENTAQAAVSLAEKTTKIYSDALNKIRETTGMVGKGAVESQSKAAAAAAKSAIDSLTIAFEQGRITSDIYGSSIQDLFNTLKSAEMPSWILQDLAKGMGVESLVSGLTEAKDVAMILEAIVAGVDELPSDDEIQALKDAAANPKDLALQTRANNIRAKYSKLTADATVEQQKLNQEKALSNALDANDIEAEAIQNQIDGYKDLVAAGMPAQLAYKLVGDAAQLAAFKQAQATDATNKNTEAVDAFIASASRIDELGKEFAALNPSGAGGSNPIQDAIDGLKKQRQEILNTSKAYSVLRRSGMDAQKAMRFAQDPNLLSAMNAGLKAGTKQWDEIIKRIQAAERATRRWQNATVQGQTEQFMEVYNKVQDLFSAEEALLQSAFEATTKADKQLIESLEEKISGFNRQIEDYSSDLDGITEKENEINKAYDEKVKALEQTKKINEDILRQQKSQLSVADALSQGNIAAAASAMQQARSENAAAALESQGNQLQLAREAQISGIRSPGGLSRAQIEERIKNLKREISVIEAGSLRLAQDRVKAAQDELDRNVRALEVGGLSKIQWEEKRAAIDAAKARASIYDGELKKALRNVEKIVAGWESLNKTITTTHNIHTVHTSSSGGGGGGGDGGGGGNGGNGGTGGGNTGNMTRAEAQKITNANYAVQNAKPGADSVKASTALAKLAGVDTRATSADAAERRINNAVSSARVVSPIPSGVTLRAMMKASGGEVGYYPMGGLIPYMANGGMFQSVNSDTVPAMLTPGEFVVRRSAVDKFGLQNLKNINNGAYGNTLSRGFNQPVYPEISRDYASANVGGGVYSSSDATQSNTQVDNSVYNYSLSVNVEGSNASPDQIANVVMRKLQDFGSQRVRGQVLR
jgi:TP901 family phage tail tape measure protein